MAALRAFSTESHPHLISVRKALAGGAYASGEELARRLGTSRTAVWKALVLLRRLGYQLEGAAGRGYRLVQAPDVPYPWELARLVRGRIGSRVVYLPSVGSTNDEARDLAEGGAPEGTVVVADRQSRGRGRRGRPWASPPGGLWFSIILRPPLSPRQVSFLPLAAGVGVARALEAACSLEPRIKWPNDVLVAGHKVCGILADLSADHEAVRYVVVGIGINVHTPSGPSWKPPPPPPPHPGAAAPGAQASLPPGGLRDLGCSAPRVEVLAGVLRELEQVYDALVRLGPEPLLEELRARLAWLGERVQVEEAGGQAPVEGRLEGIDPQNGALLVRSKGRLLRVASGDLSLRPGPAA